MTSVHPDRWRRWRPRHWSPFSAGSGRATAAAALIAVALALPPAAAGQGTAPAALPDLEVIAAGDLRGEIKPCGCSPEGQLGGLPRRLSFLESALGVPEDRRPIVVDLGNNFPAPSDQGRLKIELIQSLLDEFPPDALLPGPNELAVGLAAMGRNLRYVLSNDAVGSAFLPAVTVLRGGVRIGIYGFLSPSSIYQEFSERYRLVAVDAGWLAAVGSRKQAEHHAAAVLLFRGTDEELAAVAGSGLFDTIVVGNPFADELNQVVVRRAGGGAWPQVPTKGQGIYRLPLGAGGGALPEPEWLTERYPDHPVAVRAFAVYDEQVKSLFFDRMERLQAHRADSPFVGSETCAACHPAAAETWRATRHAKALASLEAVSKQFDPECVACHVVGLEAGGFLSRELTPHLANVQCENCHGAAGAHLADPMGKRPNRIRALVAGGGTPEAVCRTCHHGSHSPLFDYPVYWAKIAHQGRPPGAAAAAPPGGSGNDPTAD